MVVPQLSFDDFRKSFRGDVVTEEDEYYEAAIVRWATNAIRRAKVVAFVKDASDVALAIQYARSANLPIAIRGGGHNPGGASSVEGGLVVDLSRYLNGVTVDEEKKVAHVQGGAVWLTVDQTTIKYGLATVAGTISHTGVGGLITGGGYGWLTPKLGLAIDNLVKATVVVADGSILTASNDENPDLFYGIRGGGSNFGVVTEFVLQCHPQRPTVYAGAVIFKRDQIDDVAKFVDGWFPTATADEGLHCVFTRGPARKPALVVLLFYNGSEEEGRQKYKGLFDLKPINDMTKEIPFEALNSSNNHVAEGGKPWYMRGILRSDDIFKCVNTEVYDRVTAASESGEFDVTILFEYNPNLKANRIDPKATPYRRDLPGNALCLINWKTNHITAEVRKIAYSLSELVKAPDTDLAYGNYSPDSEALLTDGSLPPNRSKQLFRESYPKLQEIKRKYDPDLVFNKWFVITPA